MLTFSIGICVYNEEKNMRKLLEKLLNEKFLFDLKEIIVVASGCTDRTEDVVRKFTKRSKKIKLISEIERKGKTSAVNIILKKAKGNIIVFVCSDNIPKSGGINNLLKKFSNEKIVAVSGRPIPYQNEKIIFGYISHLIWNLHHEICKIEPKISGEFFAIRKGIIDKLPYNIINDDGYITSILRKKHYKIAYESYAITYMMGKNNIYSNLIRRRRIARGYTQLRELGLNVDISLNLIIKLIFRQIKKEPKNIINIFFAIILELIANLLAFYDTIIGEIPYRWKK